MSLTNKQKQVLEIYNVTRYCDFLRVFPFRFDILQASDEKIIALNDQLVIQGKVVSPIRSTFYAKNKSVSKFKFLSEVNQYNVTVFNRPWLKTPDSDRICTVVGKLDKNNSIVASNFLFKPINEVVGIFPIYPLKKGTTQKQIRSIMKKVYALCDASKLTFFPESILQRYHYLTFMEAVYTIHFPDNESQLKQAIQTIKYVEFFHYHLHILLASMQHKQVYKKPKKWDPLVITNFINKLTYELTDDQEKCIDEIFSDLKSEKTMMRLLQGDVGSGKTVVALISALASVSSGYQVALLAPTEILATQHYINAKKILDDPTLSIGFLSSSMSSKEKKIMEEKVKNHEIDVLIGTHAIFQDAIAFKKLGLVITDEQHRFGVMQRKALIDKGTSVDVLSMSATPIPRTLANALFSELDVSSIVTMPKNRKKIQTNLIHENSLRAFMDDLLEQIQQSHQVYIVCPAIDSNQLSTRNVVSVYNNISKVYGNEFVISMLHGQMDAQEKETIMNDFSDGNIDMLISTTVIEVGIDVGNATRLVVYDADRFGLSQLHQLRGRIGRSHLDSVCYLLTSNTDENVIKRLNVLVDHDSGFDIAYQDLLTRGPGEIVGIKQSGLPSFSFGNVVDDQAILYQTKQDAKALLDDPKSDQEIQYIERMKKENMDDKPTID